ncbi:MAG: hypothetical protein ACK4FF_02120 [Limnobacter sp.]|uniref:hypothetical protein n=1 Tax=Limnobacter sp. TaxID=2003368 RepID=UPI00391914A4
MLTRRIVDNHLVVFEPERVLPVLAPNIRAMHENRAFIRMAPCTDFVIGLLANLVVTTLDSGSRFRTYDSLRTIRQIIRYSATPPQFSLHTADLLFRLYQHYVYSAKEEIRWCVSIYLKDRELPKEQIRWLISQAPRSSHILNRLLRYPTVNEEIAAWARAALRTSQYVDRTSELLGILITDHLPSFAMKMPPETLMWAAYYSRALPRVKAEIVCNAATVASARSALEIGRRLGLVEIIRHLSTIVPEEA